MKAKRKIIPEGTWLSKHLRKGDKVVAIAGNYKGESGIVLRRTPISAVVQGLNVRKKHIKKTQQGPGQIIEVEKPIHISNLKVCVGENTPVKLRVRTDKKKGRVLYYKADDKEVVYRPVKNPK